MEQVRVERNSQGRVDTMIGCVDTGGAEINVVVSGNPIVVALSVEERLSVDEEGLRDTLDNIAGLRRTLAGADLDATATEGLIRLLVQAHAVQAQALIAPLEEGRRTGYEP
jgi:hypothetical protein